MAFAATASKRGAFADMNKAAIDVAQALARLSELTIFELRGVVVWVIGSLGFALPTMVMHILGVMFVLFSCCGSFRYGCGPAQGRCRHFDRPPLRRPRQPHEPDACEQARRALPVRRYEILKRLGEHPGALACGAVRD